MRIGSLDYYRGRHDDFVARWSELPPPSYYLSYGQKYCERFQALHDRLSAQGQRWIARTTKILQQKIEDRRAADPWGFGTLECDDKGFRHFAYSTHPDAYLEGGLNLLPPEDVLLVVHAPDARDLLNHDGIEQVVRTAWDVIERNGPIRNVDFVLEAVRELGAYWVARADRTIEAGVTNAKRDIEEVKVELRTLGQGAELVEGEAWAGLRKLEQGVDVAAEGAKAEVGRLGRVVEAAEAGAKAELRKFEQVVHAAKEGAKAELRKLENAAEVGADDVANVFSEIARIGVDWFVMRQDWQDPVFCSWRLPPAAVRHLVPAELELDLHDDAAWVSMVPLRMANVGIVRPSLPALPPFAEINLRTYVRHEEERGVYFLSLDCGEHIVNFGARVFFHLPYQPARVGIDQQGDWFECQSTSLKPEREAQLRCRYQPTGAPAIVRPGSFESFLVERYALFVVDRGSGVVHRGDVRHQPWTLQSARVEIQTNTIPSAAGLPELGAPDHVAFSTGVSTHALPFKKVT